MHSLGSYLVLVALLGNAHGGEWRNYSVPSKGGQQFPPVAPLPQPTINDSPSTNLQPPQFSPSGTQPNLSGNGRPSTEFHSAPTSSLGPQINSHGVPSQNLPGSFNSGAFPANTASASASASASAFASSSASASASSSSNAGGHGPVSGLGSSLHNLGSQNGHNRFPVGNRHPGSSATSSASASATASASASASASATASNFGGLHPSGFPSGNFNSNTPSSSLPFHNQGDRASVGSSASASSSASSGNNINGQSDSSASASSSATEFENGLVGAHGSNLPTGLPASSSASASSSVPSGSISDGQSDSSASASSSVTSSDNGLANVHGSSVHGLNNFELLSGQGGFNAIHFPTSNHASSSASASSDTNGQNGLGSSSASASASASARTGNLSPGFHTLVNGLTQGHPSTQSSNSYNVKGR